jgi:hypothetical protein
MSQSNRSEFFFLLLLVFFLLLLLLDSSLLLCCTYPVWVFFFFVKKKTESSSLGQEIKHDPLIGSSYRGSSFPGRLAAIATPMGSSTWAHVGGVATGDGNGPRLLVRHRVLADGVRRQHLHRSSHRAK